MNDKKSSATPQLTNDNICTLLSFFNLFLGSSTASPSSTTTVATWHKHKAHIVAQQFYDKSKTRLQQYLQALDSISSIVPMPALQIIENDETSVISLRNNNSVVVTQEQLLQIVAQLSDFLSAQAEPFDFDAQVQMVLKAGLEQAIKILLPQQADAKKVPFNEEQIMQVHAAKIAFSGGFMVPHECDFSVSRVTFWHVTANLADVTLIIYLFLLSC